MPESILRLPAVLARTGLSRSSIYLRVTERRFPQPVPLGARAIGWLESDITAWLDARIAERAAKPHEKLAAAGQVAV